MIVLGIDAGPTRCGWALLDFAISTSPVWQCGGTTDDVPVMLDTLIASEHLKPYLVAIERPVSLHNPLANVQVMATAWAGGAVQGHAEARGLEVVALTVPEWRQAFIGPTRRGEKADPKVKEAFARLIRQAPKTSSNHARDAAGVAWVAYQRWRARPGQLRVVR